MQRSNHDGLVLGERVDIIYRRVLSTVSSPDAALEYLRECFPNMCIVP